MEIKYHHLEGIPFKHGSDDCFGIGRRFFADNFGIQMADYARPDDWWKHGLDLYMDHFYEEGFRLVDIPLRQVRIADCFMIAIDSNVVNHTAIYVGNNEILHHLYGHFSSVTRYGGLFRNNTMAILRHKDVPNIQPVPEKLDLMEMLPPHRRRQLEELQNNAGREAASSS